MGGEAVKKISIILVAIIVVFTIFMVKDMNRSKLDIVSEYAHGKIITSVDKKDVDDITNIEYRYKTYFLDQYVDVEPREEVYSFGNYEDNHIYELTELLFQGKKDHIDIEVVVTYDEGTQEIKGTIRIKDIKKKIYDDFVIEPKIEDDKVYYRVDGFTAIIDKIYYDEKILFYSNPNQGQNIKVGFSKDYTLYRLNSYGVITKEAAQEENYEGFSLVDFEKDPEIDESYIVVEYGMIDLEWAGYYPYNLEGKEVFYESEDGGINLVKDGEMVELYQASKDKYGEISDSIPSIKFAIYK